jgi:ADP-ribose pyrophosphatase YjhB (NUDIX family)
MNESDVQATLTFLGQLNEERQGGMVLRPEVFNALLKLLPQLAVECIILRRRDDGSAAGEIEVYLTQRGADAPSHQLHWHCPGSFLRAGERFADAMARISAGELRTAQITSWHQLRVQNNHLEPRGHTVSLLHLCEIQGEPTGGQWCDIRQLPQPLVNHHADMITTAAQFLLAEPFLRHPSAAAP